MKNYTIPVTVFVAGLGFGWFVSSSASSSSAPEKEQADNHRATSRISQARSKSPTPPRSAESKRIGKAHLEKYRNSGYPSLRSASNLDLDYKAVLEQMIEESGTTGLDKHDQLRADYAMVAWYGKDPSAALKFIGGLKSTLDRNRFAKEIILSKVEGGEDFPNLLAMANKLEHLLTAKDGSVHLPEKLLTEAARRSSDDLFQLCKLSKSTEIDNEYNRRVQLNYAKDFDFKDMLDRLGQLTSTLPEGQQINELPDNLLSTWANRDPDAAYEWLKSDAVKNVPGNNHIGEFFKGIRNAASAEELGQLLADNIHSADSKETPDYRQLHEAIAVESPSKTKNVLIEFTKNLSSQKEATEHLNYLIASTGSYSSQTLEGIVGAMPSDEHMKSITYLNRSWSSADIQNVYRQYGHSVEAINEAIKIRDNPILELMQSMEAAADNK